MNTIVKYVLVAVSSIIVTLAVCAWLASPMTHGDINRDGVVDALDLSILSSHWSK